LTEKYHTLRHYSYNLPLSAAKEKLLNFREKFPILENLIPHTAIASYRRKTNISLSRLRRDLIKINTFYQLLMEKEYAHYNFALNLIIINYEIFSNWFNNPTFDEFIYKLWTD
jgi:hypothetical protein